MRLLVRLETGGSSEEMEGLLVMLAVLLVVATCCGLPILLLGAARLFKGNKNRKDEILSLQQERMLETNDLVRPTLDRRSKQEEGDGNAEY